MDYTGKSKYTIAITLLICCVAVVGYFIYSKIGNSKLDYTQAESVEEMDLITDITEFQIVENQGSENPSDSQTEEPGNQSGGQQSSQVLENIWYNIDMINYNDCIVVSFPVFSIDGKLLHKYHYQKTLNAVLVTTNNYYVFEKKITNGQVTSLELKKMIYIDDYFDFFGVGHRAYHSINVDELDNSKPYTSIDNKVVRCLADETSNLLYGTIDYGQISNFHNVGAQYYIYASALKDVKVINRITMNGNYTIKSVSEYFRSLYLSVDNGGMGYYTGFSSNIFSVINCTTGKDVTDLVNVFAKVHYSGANTTILNLADSKLKNYIIPSDSTQFNAIPIKFSVMYVTINTGNQATSTSEINYTINSVLISGTEEDPNNNGNDENLGEDDNPGNTEYCSVTFRVTNSGFSENISVTISPNSVVGGNGDIGEYTVSVPVGTYSYTASAIGYRTLTGTITITESDIENGIIIENLTFVSNGGGGLYEV